MLPALTTFSPIDPGIRPLWPAGLPIFREDGAAYSLFYAPGYVAVAAPEQADALAALLADDNRAAPEGQQREIVAELRRRARRALAAEEERRSGPFTPESLTLYLHNVCGLRCSYCYASAGPDRAGRLDLGTVRAAADLVAASCHREGRQLTVVLHGGGEPTVDLEFAEAALATVERTAAERDVSVFRYIATNGVVSEATAHWLARRLDLVGVSCDGPPDIQDGQRPTWGGGPSSPVVERTAAILRAAGQRVQVRATVTEQTVHRQEEIVSYLCETFSPEEIHIEPVYAGGRAEVGDGQHPRQAAAFVERFMAAREIALAYGVPLVYAGARLDDLHGPFCNVFRQTVNLVPGGGATACFKLTEMAAVDAAGLAVGRLHPIPLLADTATFTLDEPRIRELRQGFSRPPRCRDCFNRFHCAGDCPDQCPLLIPDGSDGPDAGGFRCQLQRRLGAAIIRDTAANLWRARLRNEAAGRSDGARVYGCAVH